MSLTRIILAGFLAGIAMFIWSSIAHMVLPLGEAGVHRQIPNEDQLLASIQTNLGDNAGLYLFPALGIGDNASRQEQKEAMAHYEEKLARNPSGFLVYHPTGTRQFSFGKLFLVEFGTELLEAILAVYLLAKTRITSFGGRTGFVFLVGIVAAIATNVSYWNWYGFPSVYIAAYMTVQIIGFLCAGLVAAMALPKTGAVTQE
jgi:hypothetical protein